MDVTLGLSNAGLLHEFHDSKCISLHFIESCPRGLARNFANVRRGTPNIYTCRMPTGLKTYPPTWEGKLLLACRKCQKKLKKAHGMGALAKLKKTIQRHNRANPDRKLHLASVPCMDLCPKGGITICLPDTQPMMLSILRNECEIESLNRTGPGTVATMPPE
jgi:hypothetical protein